MTEQQQPTPSSPKTIISGSTITAILFGVPVIGIVVGCGLLNILAAAGGWNPFHWQGRLWTGVFMIVAPSSMCIMAVLPAATRAKIPVPVLGLSSVLLWIGFFWAACGGR